MQNINLTERKQRIIKHKNLLSHIKMDKDILTFSEIQIEKIKFYHHKSPVF